MNDRPKYVRMSYESEMASIPSPDRAQLKLNGKECDVIMKLSRQTLSIVVSICFPIMTMAQSLEGRIETSIDRLIVLLNLLLVGAVAWSGFLLARGEQTAVTRLVYSVVALIVVNSARLIINYFL
ncbi:MAG: hypothetical protein JWQ35_2120 [Bacteriovoracaceae bacterium]|nr:hypothetical protein [Bacteriovoracaceae bacterium]